MVDRLPAWRIVRGAFAEAPAEVRRAATWSLVAWVGLMLLQAVDSADHPGASGVAEFASALCGSAGGVLFVLAALLEADAGRRAEATPGGDAAYRRVLIALPAIGLGAAALLAAAITLMAVRALLGAPPAFVLVVAALMGLVLWRAAATTMDAARALYRYAHAEATEAARARLVPHFLFNALNTVAALVRTDARAAEAVVEDLSDVLRLTLERTAGRVATIDDELRYVRAYLAVERARWGERLRVEWDVDPAAGAVPLPPLVLQPLVENALRHGLGGRIDGGVVRVGVRLDGPALRLTVRDDGEGFPPRHRERTGLGGLRQRLADVYGDAATLTIARDDDGGGGGGARVTVAVPVEVDAGARARRR